MFSQGQTSRVPSSFAHVEEDFDLTVQEAMLEQEIVEYGRHVRLYSYRNNVSSSISSCQQKIVSRTR